MKKVLSILVFTCYALVGYSQSTTQFGVTAEGSWFMPQPPMSGREYSTKAGFGVYRNQILQLNLSYPIWQKQ